MNTGKHLESGCSTRLFCLIVVTRPFEEGHLSILIDMVVESQTQGIPTPNRPVPEKGASQNGAPHSGSTPDDGACVTVASPSRITEVYPKNTLGCSDGRTAFENLLGSADGQQGFTDTCRGMDDKSRLGCHPPLVQHLLLE